MKWILTGLSLLCLSFFAHAQNNPPMHTEVQIGEIFYEDLPNADRRLEHLQSETKRNNLTLIAEISHSSDQLNSLYYPLHHSATRLGAEIYELTEMQYDSLGGIYSARWRIYHAPDSIREYNRRAMGENHIYIIGDPEKDLKFKLNNQKTLLGHHQVIMEKLEVGEAVKIGKGGLLGTTALIYHKTGQMNRYFYFSGGKLSPAVGMGGSVGVSFTVAGIEEYPIPFGSFLVEAYSLLNREDPLKLQDFK